MKRFAACLFIIVSIAYCDDPRKKLYDQYHANVSEAGDLTDEMVLNYIRTYRNLRAYGIRFEEYLADNPDKSSSAYQDIEGIMQEGGFEDFADFVRVNAKIAWAWNLSQAERGMQKQADLQTSSQKGMDDGIRIINEQLNDPNVPEETKAELRAVKEELMAGKQELKQTYDHNMKWANWSMEFVKPLTNEQDMQVIKRHEKELMQVFTGLSAEQLDRINDHTIQVLEIE